MSRNQPAHKAPVRPPREPFRDQGLELLALFALIAVSAFIYDQAGPAGFSAVISAGVSLFVAWKSRK